MTLKSLLMDKPHQRMSVRERAESVLGVGEIGGEGERRGGLLLSGVYIQRGAWLGKKRLRNSQLFM